MPKSKLVLSREDYSRIEKMCDLKGDEDYAVVTTRHKGLIIRSIHVFARQPMTKELTEYENTASKVKFKGNRAEVEGSQLLAAKHLYDHLISRAYDVPVGRAILGELKEVPGEREGESRMVGTPLQREDAIAKVPVMIKREAVRDMVAQHWSSGQLVEMEGDEEEVKGDTEED